ncbi:MAG: DoxX family protein [Myxococcota bacterium]
MSAFRRFVLAPPGASSEWALAGLRIFFGLAMALGHGLNKFPVSPRWVQNVAALGFPLPVVFAWVATLSELLGGLLLAAGLLTRVAAGSIAVTMAVAAFLANGGVWKNAELAFIFLVVSVFFFFHGGGKLSVDRWLSR